MFGLSLLAIGCSGSGPETTETETKAEAEPVLVAAASSLQKAMPEIAQAFEEQTGHAVDVSFGSSGMLAAQIEQGAPFDLFLSADRRFVDRLAKKGAIDPKSVRDYAQGRLVLVTAPLLNRTEPIERLDDLKQPEIRALAIAEPSFAPYGRAARQVLERSGLWEPLLPKIVRGRSVRQVLHYVETGNADAALVAASLVPDDRFTSEPVDPKLYDPIVQRLGIPSEAPHPSAAQALADFLIEGPGRSTLSDYRFDPAANPEASPTNTTSGAETTKASGSDIDKPETDAP